MISQEKIEVENYFLGKTKKFNVLALTYQKAYRDAVIDVVSDNFDKKEIYDKFIIMFSVLKLETDMPYELYESIYKKYISKSKKVFNNNESCQKVNDITKYLTENTDKDDIIIFDISARIMNILTNSDNLIYSSEDDNEFDSESLTKNEVLFDEHESLKEKEIKKKANEIKKQEFQSLNPTKTAQQFLSSGLPEDISTLNKNIKNNEAFPIALLSAMANQLALIEIKGNYDVEIRKNYLKIFKLMNENMTNYGIQFFIRTYKDLSASDDEVVRFFNIWFSLLNNYDGFSDYNKKLILTIFKQETVENFKRYRIKQQEKRKEKIDQAEKAQREKKTKHVTIDNVEISPEELKVYEREVSYIFNYNEFSADFNKVIKNENNKYGFLRIFSNDVAYMLKNAQKQGPLAEISDNISKVLVELPVDDFKDSLAYFFRRYYQISGKLLTNQMRLVLIKSMKAALAEKFSDDKQQEKIYVNIYLAEAINTNYISKDE